MKTLRTTLILVLAVLLLLWLWSLRPHPTLFAPTKRAERKAATPAATGVTNTTRLQTPPTIAQLSKLPPDEAAKVIEKQRQGAEGRQMQRTKAWLDTQNGKINFWGVVLDQDEKPLQGVQVVMSTRHWGGPDGASFPKFTAVSDAAGRFKLLDAQGDSLGIEQVNKPGYGLSPEDKSRAISFGYYGYAKPFVPNPEAPVVIRLWKLKGAVPLIYHRGVQGKVAVDGTPTKFDLVRGRQVEQGGQMEVRLMREPRDIVFGKRNGYGWKAKITVPGGGVRAREDLSGLEAPVEGYAETVEFGQEADDPKWKDHFEGQFYVRTQKGQYSRIVFYLGTDYQPPPCGCGMVEVFLNPTGSTNLEYDSWKRVNF